MGLAMQVENISAGGMFVKSDDLLPMGSPISLELLDGAPTSPLKLTGRVVGHVTRWQAQTHGRVPGMGIEFDPLDADSQKRLDKLLANLKSQKAADPPFIDADVETTRSQAFDFGFSSLEDFAREQEEDDAAPERAPEPVASKPAETPKVVPAPADQMAVPQDAKLMVQVRGLMMELGDTQGRIARLERENEELRAEVRRLNDELVRYRRPL